MAQMAPALTEASASPESSRKHSVDRHCSLIVQEEFKQETTGLALDLKLVSQNGLVRLISDNNIADITNTIKPSEQNTPIVSRVNEEIKGKTEMPNGHCDGKVEKKSTNMSSCSPPKEEMRNTALDLSRTTCASTAKTSAGTCNTVCEKDERNRVSQHPVANLESGKTLIPQRTSQAFRRQAKLEGRAKKIETRLRKLQTRQLGDHVLQQLESLAQKHGETRDSSSVNPDPEGISGAAVIPKSKSVSNNSPELEADRVYMKQAMPGNFASRVKNNDAKTVDNVIKELEHISAVSLNNVDRTVLNDFKDFGKQSDAVGSVESWSSQCEFLENVHDSDATEGSSGEESEDESEPRKTKLRSKRAKILRRQYHLEEGVIASHWSWLQSQIINVERQIRRYDDLYKGGRMRKGTVKLQACTSDAALVRSPSEIDGNGIVKGFKNSSLTMSSLDVTKSKCLADYNKKEPTKEPDNHVLNGVKRSLLDSSLLNEEDVPVKRYRPVVATNDSTDSKLCPSLPSNSNDIFPQCARTRGVYTVRKRRLVQLSHIKNGKPKPLSLFCGCVTPTTPCLICSKSARTLSIVNPNQTMAEKVASLDASFHPVLSFCTDIPLQLHFGALLKRGGFEKRTKPQALRNTQIVEKKKPPVVAKAGKRRVQLAKGTAASLLSSARLHNQKYERKRGYSVSSTPKNSTRNAENRVTQSDGPRKKRAAAISAAAQLQKRARSLSLPTVVSSPSTPTSTPSPTSTLAQSMPSNLASLLKKKKGSNAFDINNIVIPYSMASATRVEKLQYKEIPTPSWRFNELAEGDVAKVEVEEPDDNENEDTSDEIYVSRHGFCEEHERKRFLGLVKKKRKRTSRQSSEISNLDPPSPLTYPDSQGGTPPGTPNCNTPLPTPTGASLPSSLAIGSAPPPSFPSSTLSPSGITTPTSAMPPIADKFHRSLSDSKLAHRRSSSTDRSEKSVNDEEMWPPVPPWPERIFPLSDSDFSSLKLPTPLPTPASSLPASPSASSPGSPMCSPLASPASDASSEKNEWTVKLVTDQGPGSGSESGGPARKGIVLKLAKR